jgi:L-ascorbate metabolism protein UlaG (beta-lactamase superfamily)
MEIVWYGHSCYKFVERNMATVVTDPYDYRETGYAPLKLKANIVTISCDSPYHNHHTCVEDSTYIIQGPGEYEIGKVFITGISTSKRTGEQNDRNNTLYLFSYQDINVMHLGNLNHVPNQAEVESLGPVHIALVPVGGSASLTASKASDVISLFEPNIVIPMQYAVPGIDSKLDPINMFLKEMGLTEVETTPSLKINSSKNLPNETQVVVLDYQRRE